MKAEIDGKSLALGALGGLVMGFSLGLGFILAQRVMNRKNGAAATANAGMSNAHGARGAQPIYPPMANNGWGSDGWISDAKARFLDDQHTHKDFYGSGFVDEYAEPTQKRRSDLNFDWTTGQSI